ncbi:MAG: hypothetical protein CMM94_06485 [Rickettsiales bacterium]|nr:hypothetical protein [Rickettsiales bacterium]
MRIFVIRHGESVGNVDEAAFEKYENYYIPLTKFGAHQAEQSGAFLRDYLKEHPGGSNGKVTLWSGPYRRVVQTKNKLLGELGDHIADTEQHYLLRERFNGIFDNIRKPERQEALFPKEFAAFIKEIDEKGLAAARPPGGESNDDVAVRLKRFIDNYVGDDKDLVIVTHGAVANALEYHLCGRSHEWLNSRVGPEGRLANGEIQLLEGDREHGFSATSIYKPKQRAEAAHITPAMNEPFGGPFPERRAITSGHAR